MEKKCRQLSKMKRSTAITFKRARKVKKLIRRNNDCRIGSEGGFLLTTCNVSPLYRLLALLKQVLPSLRELTWQFF
jgi:hypothetical protein